MDSDVNYLFLNILSERVEEKCASSKRITKDEKTFAMGAIVLPEELKTNRGGTLQELIIVPLIVDLAGAAEGFVALTNISSRAKGRTVQQGSDETSSRINLQEAQIK